MKRIISILMVICLVFSFVPIPAAALEQDETVETSESSGIIYSDDVLMLDDSDGYLQEDAGSQTMTISRVNVSKAASYTLAIYDTSANYGQDYQVFYDGSLVEKIEGATSIYDVFRDQGQLTSGQMLDLASMVGQIESMENGEEQQDVSAAEMLAQLDDLGVKAVSIPVTFEAGEDSVSLTIQVIDDLEPEYDEDFMIAILDEDGQMVETAQKIYTIVDNDSPAPSYEVFFDCDSTLELDQESGEAELVFKRTGDLGTNSRNALCVDGEPLGWVDFAPWQDTQTVWVIQAGTFTLLDDEGYFIEGQQVEVEDNRPTETAEVEDGADPILDAVPEEYAVIRSNRQSVDTSWLPSWARGTSYSNESTVVVMGTTSNNLFVAGGNWSKGEVEFFVDEKNFHNVSTSGTGTYISTGYLFADSIAKYDFTGVESVTSVAYSTGVDDQANISIGVQNIVRKTINITEGGTNTLTVTLPDKYQGSQKVYYGNEDPEKYNCGGTEMYVPNGFVMNLRQYRFVISDDSSLVTPLEYTGGSKPGKYVPGIVSSKAEQYMTINSKTYGKNKTIDIVYTTDTQYPAELIGFKIRNMKDGTTSGMIGLYSSKSSENANTVTRTASFTFDASFLKKYESQYCAKVKNDQGTECWTFQIIPVYQKVKATQIDILTTREGSMTMRYDPYIGDKVRFSDYSSDVVLAGVWYEAKKGVSDSIASTGVTYDRVETSGRPDYDFSILYPVYRFKGVYNNDATKLAVYYADDEAASLGKLEKEGEVVSEDQYVVGDYVALMATPNNNSYVTRWDVNGTYYYGNVYYHQLNGNPDDNIVKVEFIKNSNTITTTLVGTLTRGDTDLRTGITNYYPMTNVRVTITADKTYTATTDEKGGFSISQFNGVSGATYSMAVDYGTVTGYNTFEYSVISGSNVSHAVNVQMAQLPAGVPYPDTILANVNGTGYNQNMLELLTDGTMTASVRVYCPPKNFKITDVNFYFLDEGVTISNANGTAFEATYESTLDNFQTWTLSAATSQIKSGTQLYVEVLSERTTYDDKGTVITKISSGLINCGYGFTKPDEEKIYYTNYDIPSTPGMNSVKAVSLKDLWMPCLGSLDFSITSKTGGFFSQRNDAYGNLILTCGSEYLSSFGSGSVSEKWYQKQKTKEAVAEKKASKALEDQPVGGSDTTVNTITPGDQPAEGETGDPANAKKNKKPSNWSLSPAFLFRIVLSKGDKNPDETFITQYEMTLGIDAAYARNFPFNINGCPLYVFVNFTTEAYFDLQVNFDNDVFNLDNFLDAWYDMLENDAGAMELNTFIAAPIMKLSLTGGLGYNNFASLYIRGSVNAPFIFSIYPIGVAAELAFTLGGGMNVVLFDLNLNYTVTVPAISSDDELMKDLTTLKGLANAPAPTSVQSLDSNSSGLEIASLEDVQNLDLNTLFNEGTFKVTEHTKQLRRSSREAGDVATDVFKNTGIHLNQLDNGTIQAFYLRDTAGDDSETLNWLTVAYAQSTDGGDTWTEMGYVCDNTANPNTSIQYDINVYQLEDRTLVTWSEANFDEVLEHLGDVDVNSLTPAQVAKFMNAMNLRGRFFDSEGQPMGKAFTIAENSTVACGALDAVQNGDMVYVYYQRNVFPYDESEGEEVTATQLLNAERTIALARANVNSCSDVDGKSVWTSTTVRATNEKGQEYRVTDVEPFVHDGVMGEILVLDRDGKLAEWDESSGTWENSIEDRQLYLRTYEFGEDGTPAPSALMAITDTDDCAQSPQVVSNDDYLHLFWNQNGKVVYITDFVATAEDHEDVQAGAYVVKNADGTVTAQDLKEYGANDIASDGSFHAGTTFSAAMDENGNVLLSWVATDTTSDDELPTDEVYGVVLNTVTNAQAVEMAKNDTEHGDKPDYDGNENAYQLVSQGSPVALTDEKALINALDSLFVNNEGSFLLAYSQFNSTDITEVTGADIKTVKSKYESDLEITEVYGNKYPMPGSDMLVDVTVTNNGLGTAKNVAVTASGVGVGATGTIDSLLPGCSTTVTLTVKVPEGFKESALLTVEAKADSTAESSMDVLYAPRFEVYEMPDMTNIPGTSDYLTETLVYNAGNAPGIPTIDYSVILFARNDDAVNYTYTADEEVAPGGSIKMVYTLEDTPVVEGTTGMLSVTTGSGADQYIQNYMPKLAKYLDVSGISGIEDDEPDEPDTPVVPSRPSKPSSGSGSGSGSVSGSGSSQLDEVIDSYVETPVSFTDVAEGSWYYDYVMDMANAGVINGYPDGTFRPQGEVTWGEALKLVMKAVGYDDIAALPGGHWASGYMSKALEDLLVSSEVDLDAAITRGEMANLVANALKLAPSDNEYPFEDYAPEAAVALYAAGIITGSLDSGHLLFRADSTITRAEMATIIWRVYNK